MSRGFRDADTTVLLSSQAAADALDRIHQVDAEQAEHAAERRAEGKAGLCEDCGSAIEADRLAVLPDATRCVGCQARSERAAQQPS